MAVRLFRRSSAGCRDVVPGWEVRGVRGVEVPSPSAWTCTWCCFSPGAGARGFLLLPTGARPSRTSAGASQMPSDTAKSQRGRGPTVLPAVTWGPPSAGRFTRTGGHFPRDGAGRVGAAWHFHRFLLFTSLFLFLPSARCPRGRLPLPSPASQNQKWDLDKRVRH